MLQREEKISRCWCYMSPASKDGGGRRLLSPIHWKPFSGFLYVSFEQPSRHLIEDCTQICMNFGRPTRLTSRCFQGMFVCVHCSLCNTGEQSVVHKNQVENHESWRKQMNNGDEVSHRFRLFFSMSCRCHIANQAFFLFFFFPSCLSRFIYFAEQMAPISAFPVH